MPSLPTEMWLEILRYIPTQSAYPKLLAVNSVVFHILMDRQWRNVTIVTSIYYVAMRTVHRLQDPAVAARVRSMNLDVSLGKEPIDDMLASLASCITNLVNITEFSSYISTQGGVKQVNTYLRSLFKDIWVFVGPKLRSLTLDAPVSQYEYFVLDKSMLSSLKKLDLGLCHASSPTGPEDSSQTTILTTSILSWLSSTSHQLESLGLTFSGPVSRSSEFLEQTPPFLRLTSLSLLLPSNATASSFHHFLQHCVAGLHTLNLNFGHLPLGEIDITQISGCLRRSKLQTLIIRPQCSPANSLRVAEVLGKVIYAVRESVTCVVATTDEWSTTEEFLPLFTALATCHLLKHLDIQITSLNTVILGKLAQLLPDLDSLVILHQMHYRSPQYESFYNALTTEDYSGWHLKGLSLYRNTRTTPDRRLAASIRRRVPSIQHLFTHNA